MSEVVDRCYEKFKNLIERRGLFEDIDQFLILFSCGKDCSMMLDLFIRYYKESGMTADYSIFSAPFPKHLS